MIEVSTRSVKEAAAAEQLRADTTTLDIPKGFDLWTPDEIADWLDSVENDPRSPTRTSTRPSRRFSGCWTATERDLTRRAPGAMSAAGGRRPEADASAVARAGVQSDVRPLRAQDPALLEVVRKDLSLRPLPRIPVPWLSWRIADRHDAALREHPDAQTLGGDFRSVQGVRGSRAPVEPHVVQTACGPRMGHGPDAPPGGRYTTPSPGSEAFRVVLSRDQ